MATDPKEIYKFHTPTPEKTKRYRALKEEAIRFHSLILELCPNCRHRSLALNGVETAEMFAIRSIALDEADSSQ